MFHFLKISVETISDLIYTQFYGENGDKWCEAYGNFCSCHNEAISIFKDLMKSDRRFQQFIRQCSGKTKKLSAVCLPEFFFARPLRKCMT